MLEYADDSSRYICTPNMQYTQEKLLLYEKNKMAGSNYNRKTRFPKIEIFNSILLLLTSFYNNCPQKKGAQFIKLLLATDSN